MRREDARFGKRVRAAVTRGARLAEGRNSDTSLRLELDLSISPAC